MIANLIFPDMHWENTLTAIRFSKTRQNYSRLELPEYKVLSLLWFMLIYLFYFANITFTKYTKCIDLRGHLNITLTVRKYETNLRMFGWLHLFPSLTILYYRLEWHYFGCNFFHFSQTGTTISIKNNLVWVFFMSW